MKFRSIVIVLVLLTLCNITQALTLQFTWDANTEPNVKGYKLHHGTTSGVYTQAVDVENVTTYLQDVPEGRNYYALTAYTDDPELESEYSKEIAVPFLPPDGPRFKDSFNTDTSRDYFLTFGKQKQGSVYYDDVGNKLGVKTGDNFSVFINRAVPEHQTGQFSMLFEPTRKYPIGGRMAIKLIESKKKFIHIENTDGYPTPGFLRAVINGKEISKAVFVTHYTQGKAYPAQLSFSPTRVTVSAFGEEAAISLPTPFNVRFIQVSITQQDCKVDDLLYTGKLVAVPLRWPVKFRIAAFD